MANIWIDTIFNEDIAVAGQSLVSLMTGISSTQSRFDRMTLLRTIIGLDVARTTHDSGEGSERVSMGIGIASQESFAAGTVPDPETNTDFPIRGWIWRAQYRVFGFAADDPTIFTRRIDLDLRSMRKLDNGECYLVSANVALEGTSSTNKVMGLVRQLWKVS